MSIKINNKEIKEEDIFLEMQYHPSMTSIEAMEKAARALVIKEVLLQEIERLGIVLESNELQQLEEISNDNKKEELLIDKLLSKELKVPDIDNEILENFYFKNKEKFKTKDKDNILEFNNIKGIIHEYLKDISLEQASKEYIKYLLNQSNIQGISLEKLIN